MSLTKRPYKQPSAVDGVEVKPRSCAWRNRGFALLLPRQLGCARRASDLARWPGRNPRAHLPGAAVDNPYAVKCAALFVASGCALGALLGLLYDVAVTRRR